jgi:hypothetical protein
MALRTGRKIAHLVGSNFSRRRKTKLHATGILRTDGLSLQRHAPCFLEKFTRSGDRASASAADEAMPHEGAIAEEENFAGHAKRLSRHAPPAHHSLSAADACSHLAVFGLDFLMLAMSIFYAVGSPAPILPVVTHSRQRLAVAERATLDNIALERSAAAGSLEAREHRPLSRR